MSGDVKISFFQATVESILLYGCECWTLTPTLQKSLDGCYTRMLRMVLNVDWRDHVSNKTLYGMLPRISQKIAYRRMGMAGHCCRHPELPASRLVLWEPNSWGEAEGKTEEELCRCPEERCWGGDHNRVGCLHKG